MKSVIVNGKYNYIGNESGAKIIVVGADYVKRIILYQRIEYSVGVQPTYKIEWELFFKSFEYIVEEQLKLL